MKIIVALIFCLFSQTLSLALAAQVDNGSCRTMSYDRKFAVVIGVDRFAQSEWDLKYARKDADDFASYLDSDARFARAHVKVVTGDVTLQRTANALNWLASSCSESDLALVYLRTRGTFPELSPDGHAYFALSDSNSRNIKDTVCHELWR